jgi:hypothetical protein
MTCSQANKYPFSPRLPCRQQTCSAQVKEPTDLQPQIRVLHFSAAAHRAKMMLCRVRSIEWSILQRGRGTAEASRPAAGERQC